MAGGAERLFDRIDIAENNTTVAGLDHNQHRSLNRVRPCQRAFEMTPPRRRRRRDEHHGAEVSALNRDHEREQAATRESDQGEAAGIDVGPRLGGVDGVQDLGLVPWQVALTGPCESA